MMKLVILPGWGGTKETWQKFIDLAQKDFDVICLNLPCFGDESCPDKVWGVKKYSDFVKLKIENLKIENCMLLGHSFGGQIAAYLVARNPQIASKLILSGPAVFRPKKNLKRFILGVIAKTGKLMFNLPFLEKYQYIVKELLYKAIGSSDFNETSGIKREIFKEIIRQDLTELLPKISVPTLIIWGDKDGFVPVSDAYKSNKLIPHSKLEIIKNGRHGLHLQQPENLYKIISGFAKK